MRRSLSYLLPLLPLLFAGLYLGWMAIRTSELSSGYLKAAEGGQEAVLRTSDLGAVYTTIGIAFTAMTVCATMALVTTVLLVNKLRALDDRVVELERQLCRREGSLIERQLTTGQPH